MVGWLTDPLGRGRSLDKNCVLSHMLCMAPSSSTYLDGLHQGTATGPACILSQNISTLPTAAATAAAAAAAAFSSTAWNLHLSLLVICLSLFPIIPFSLACFLVSRSFQLPFFAFCLLQICCILLPLSFIILVFFLSYRRGC